MKTKSRIRMAGTLLLACMVMAVVWSIREVDYYGINYGEPYASFESPDGRFKIEVYAHKKDGVFPGQTGDVPGVVLLKDAKGKILNKKSIEMVQLVDSPAWSSDRVEQRLIFDWKLP